jgi:hypothetical protein
MIIAENKAEANNIKMEEHFASFEDDDMEDNNNEDPITADIERD